MSRLIFTVLLTGLIIGIAADGKDRKLSRKERFAMKYMEAASMLNREDRSEAESDTGQFNTVVDIGEHAEFPFFCREEYTPSPGPQSVHELQPADIDVVAAIGDSVTAASGVDAIFIIGSLTQYRGSSWSIGGDGSIGGDDGEDPIITIPNIIKYFKERSGNPEDLNGYSTGVGHERTYDARLNQAVIGATAEDLVEQAQIVIDKMKATNTSVSDTLMDFDYEDSWKLMTILVGGNDMCDYCVDRERYSAEKYKENFKKVLDLLSEVPRMYINIVPMFSVTTVKYVSKGPSCDIFQKLICECAMDNSIKDEMDQLAEDYHQALVDLIETDDYEREDFAVVLQESFTDFAPIRDPETQEVDRTIFAPDCFHPSRLGHELLAYILWNTMIKWPVGIKPTRYPIYAERGDCIFGRCGNNYEFACPTREHRFLWTRTNSKNVSLSEFNYTTTTTTLRPTTSTTTAPQVVQIQEEEDDGTAWIAVGCIIGVVGIFAISLIAYLFLRDRKDDEKSFFA